MIFKGFVVGAYAASPAHRVWDETAELDFYSALENIRDIGALELPWMGSIHPHNPSWLARHLPTRFGAVITDVPHVMGRLAQDSFYGLASSSEEGRSAALADALRMRDDIDAFNNATGRKVVGAVELHSAPQVQGGAADALKRSLAELSSWDWSGAQLVIEHCDAWRDTHAPEKGFLELSEEVAAIENSGTGVGVALNWGRSVIEGRSVTTAVEHARMAREHGLLRGFIASGVSAEETDFGYAWIDAHLPFAPSSITPSGIRSSLMTVANIARVLNEADGVDWLGVKVGSLTHATMAQRVAVVQEAVAALSLALASSEAIS